MAASTRYPRLGLLSPIRCAQTQWALKPQRVTEVQARMWAADFRAGPSEPLRYSAVQVPVSEVLRLAGEAA